METGYYKSSRGTLLYRDTDGEWWGCFEDGTIIPRYWHDWYDHINDRQLKLMFPEQLPVTRVGRP